MFNAIAVNRLNGDVDFALPFAIVYGAKSATANLGVNFEFTTGNLPTLNYFLPKS
jgi:hypothetical protein